MVVHFISVRIDVLLEQKWKKPVIIPSECQDFGLIYNSSNSEIFVCPHGSSLCSVSYSNFHFLSHATYLEFKLQLRMSIVKDKIRLKKDK